MKEMSPEVLRLFEQYAQLVLNFGSRLSSGDAGAIARMDRHRREMHEALLIALGCPHPVECSEPCSPSECKRFQLALALESFAAHENIKR